MGVGVVVGGAGGEEGEVVGLQDAGFYSAHGGGFEMLLESGNFYTK